MTSTQAIITVLIVGFITMVIRLSPFLFFRKREELPEVIKDLGDLLPYSMMALLVVYCLKGIHFQEPSGFVPLLSGVVITAVSYKWKKKLILSMVLGTVVYMFFVQQVFV